MNEPCDGLGAGQDAFCVHHLPTRKSPALCVRNDDGTWAVVAYFRGEAACQHFRQAMGNIADAAGMTTRGGER